jgi:hypothetical protein
MSDSQHNRLLPNTFQTPNLLVVFAYRHIYGWPETSAARQARLSVSAFEHGHRGSTGCGLGRAAIIAALEGLAQFGVMRAIGEPTSEGQMWGLAEHQREIDWRGLERRAQEQQKRRRRQTSQATRARAQKRAVKPGTSNGPAVRSTNQPAGTSNEPPAGTFNEPRPGTSNVPDPGSSNEPIETQSLKPSEKPISETHPSSPEGSVDSTPGAGAVGDGDLEFILPAIRKLHLSQEAQERLLGLGAQTALAIALASQGPGVRNPAGLAVTMMANGGPPELDLERAEIALELGTLNREAIDGQLRKREYARIAEQMNELVVQKAGQGDAPGAQASTDPEQPSPSSSVPDPPVDDTGLSYRPGSGRLTIRDLWLAALGQLKLQLNRSTFDNWVQGTKARSYADGVLTVQARHLMARDMLVKNDWLGDAMTRLAGKPVQVRVVLAGEGVER